MTGREEFVILKPRHLSLINSHEKRICLCPDLLRGDLGDCNWTNNGIRIVPPPCPVRYGSPGAGSFGQKRNHVRSNHRSAHRYQSPHHVHKQYTRVVLDLTGRVVVKETKNARKATISLTHVRLSKRARQHVKGQNFPRAISIAPGGAGTVHIILDLQALRTYRVLTLDNPDRVVVDLFYAIKTRPAKPETRTKQTRQACPRRSSPTRSGI